MLLLFFPCLCIETYNCVIHHAHGTLFDERVFENQTRILYTRLPVLKCLGSLTTPKITPIIAKIEVLVCTTEHLQFNAVSCVRIRASAYSCVLHYVDAQPLPVGG